MKEFLCRKGDAERRVDARTSESACKKAFRSPPGWHWAPCSEERAEVIVIDAERTHTFFHLWENG